MKIEYVINNSIFLNGIQVIENWAIENDKFYQDKQSGNVYIPENGMIYKIIFMDVLTKESIDMACRFALNKVKSFIKEKHD
jgi:hypothetical protein